MRISGLLAGLIVACIVPAVSGAPIDDFENGAGEAWRRGDWSQNTSVTYLRVDDTQPVNGGAHYQFRGQLAYRRPTVGVRARPIKYWATHAVMRGNKWLVFKIFADPDHEELIAVGHFLVDIEGTNESRVTITFRKNLGLLTVDGVVHDCDPDDDVLEEGSSGPPPNP